MPLQNRVDPFGRLVATLHRGKLMGNRGLIHGSHQNIEREFRGKRWIYCVLEFKGRRRKPMTPGLYTELFFLDEATASLDEPSETALYRLLAERLPATTLVSIGHRSTLEAFHTRHLALVRDGEHFALRERAGAR